MRECFRLLIGMQMILPINVKPTITSYTHHSYPCAIIEQGMGQSLVTLELNIDSESFEEETTNDVFFEKQGKRLEIWDKKYAENTECFLIKTCDEIDELEVDVKNIRADAINGIVNLVICAEDYLECAHINRNIYRIGIVENVGLLCSENGNFLTLNVDKKKQQECTRIKIRRDGKKIAYWAYDNGIWLNAFCTELSDEMTDKKMYIGINANFGENQYYNWKYMNYLQLCYSENDGFVWLDYFIYPRKNFSYNHFQQFINVEYWKTEEVEELFGGVWEGIRWLIKNGYYVEVPLDEFYVKNRLATNNFHFEHNNLLYGFSAETDVLLALGYAEKIKVAEVDRETFEKCISKDSTIKVLKYKPNNMDMPFDIENFTDKVRDFLQGKNSWRGATNILPIEDYSFGLDVFGKLLNSPKGKDMIQNDCRVSFLLYEHANIMLERLEYLKERNIFTQNEYDMLQEKCKRLLKKIEILKNLVLKNRVKREHSDRILSRLKIIEDDERKFYSLLLDVLCKKRIKHLYEDEL